MSRYLKISLKNLDPLRIADDRTSQHGQTGTLRYIPGSALRGYVMSELAKNEAEFAAWKAAFFNGQVKVLNAYLTVGEKELIPSLKGFYEDKKAEEGEKDIENVLKKEVSPGFKRASLGSYCYVDGDCIHYINPECSEDININNGRTVEKKNPDEDNRNIYRSQYICKDQKFIGYVVLADGVDSKLADRVKKLLSGTVHVGNRRSGGYGTCVTACEEIKNIPYAAVRTQKAGTEFYMVLLSNLVMRSEIGELTGLNLEELAERLGCNKLELKRCAASTAQVYGYNRIWKGTIPSANMYEAGSVFCFVADAEIPEERFRQVEAEGLGIRTPEGFGQVAFMAGFGEIRKKLKIDKKEEEEKAKAKADKEADAKAEIAEVPFGFEAQLDEDRRLAACGLLQHRIERGMERYVVEHDAEVKEVSSSQWGQLASMCIVLQYTPEKAEQYLGSFLSNSRTKEESSKRHDGKQKKDSFHRYMERMIQTGLLELLGINQEKILGVPVAQLLDPDEQVRYKLQLMERQIRYANREGRSHG